MKGISLYLNGQSLDVYDQDIEWSWTNIRFSDGIRDQYSTDITLPKTFRNASALEVSGLLDSTTQLYGSQLTPCTLTVNGSIMDVYMQVVSITEDEISICLYERTLPAEVRNANMARLVEDNDNTIIAWNTNSLSAYPNWFKKYHYGIPYDPKYAQYHPILPANTIIDNIKDKFNTDIPYVSNDWYIMATKKCICPQNTRQTMEGVYSDGKFNIMGGQHITNDLKLSYGLSGTDRITFNRSCKVEIDLWISWQAKELNGYNIPFVVNHWKASNQTNDTHQFNMRGDLYTNKVDRVSYTFYVDIDDHISFGVVNASEFVMTRCLADMRITEYDITEDDYGKDMEYISRLPRLVVYNYASGGYYYWYFDASEYDLAWHERGVSGTKHKWVATVWTSFAWFGYYANLPEMKVSDFLWGLCWLMGKKVKILNNTLEFVGIDSSTVLEKASITEISPITEKFGMKNYLRFDDQEFAPVLTSIDNSWLEAEKDLHKSPFGYIKNLSQYSGQALQYENPEYDDETEQYSCDFNDVGFLIWWNVTQQGNMQVISEYIRDIPINKMGLDKITQTMQVEIESDDICLKDIDYVYLDGRKFMVVEGSTAIDTSKSKITAMLVPSN